MFPSTLAATLLLAVSALAADHVVTVGQDASGASKLVYTPESVTAAVGDSVTFTFPGTTHTATLSSFAAPCTAAADATAFNVGGTPGGYAFNVTSDKPVWFYCKTGSHCAAGMVFAINPTANKTFEAFKATAMGASSTTTNSSSPAASASSTASSGYGSTGAAGRGYEVAGTAAIVGAFLSVVVGAVGV
ncbi:hypothetical protein BDY24DRAFT_367787 [Mrakia frigida]|uniref:cupredoxin domain-containing protein n=1 Tax=Mrakia frigida TaxID=29902 RepID=UPI003FCC1B00